MRPGLKGKLAVGTTSVLMFAAFGATSHASANVSCNHNGNGTPLDILVDGNGNQTVRIKVSAGGIAVSNETSGVVAVTCANDSTPALTEVTAINISDTSVADGNTNLVVDHGAGRFEPGFGVEAGTAEIEIDAALGTGTGDQVRVLPPTGASNDTIRAGDLLPGGARNDGLNVNDDDDNDFSFGDSTESFILNGDTPNSAETGTDTITASGIGSPTQGSYPGGSLGANNLNAFGGGGDDTIVGKSTGNLLVGDTGNDVLIGGGGGDTMRPGTGNDTVDGAGGTTDSVSYFGTSGGVRFDLAAQPAQQDTLAGGLDAVSDVESASGSVDDDVILGTNGDDGFISDGDVVANGGDDTLVGRGGNDNLQAGLGDDTLVGGTGDDTFFGGPGADTASYAQDSAGPVQLSLNPALTGVQQPTGGAGADTLTDAPASFDPADPDASHEVENIVGSPFGGDVLTGNDQPNFIDVRDGFGDAVACLGATDSARADQATVDSVNADCDAIDFLAPVITPIPETTLPTPAPPTTKKCKKAKKKKGKGKKKCKRKKKRS